MAQTTEGALKIRARKAGLTVEEYRAKQQAGFKLCWKCGHWKEKGAFAIDRSREDGLSAICRQCHSRRGYPDHMTRAERIRASVLHWRGSFVSPMKGKKHTLEARRKMSEAAKRRPSNHLGKKHTPETRAKIAAITRERTARGEQHYAYSHGKHQRDRCDRRTVEYKDWRNAVFARDKYTCQNCRDNRGGNLQAHHIKSFADHPELRFAVENGITYCQDCHEKLHLKPIPMPKDLRRRKKHKS